MNFKLVIALLILICFNTNAQISEKQVDELGRKNLKNIQCSRNFGSDCQRRKSNTLKRLWCKIDYYERKSRCQHLIWDCL